MAEIPAGTITNTQVFAMLHEIKEDLKDMQGCGEARMLLYGSRARGDFDEHSDIDVAIIVENLSRDLKARILGMIADKELTYLTPLSVIVFSSHDFNLLRERERRIALDIEAEGILL
jgi:predicted nucleotidyltransferase